MSLDVSWTESNHPDDETLAILLAEQLETLIRTALLERGKAVLALAGGRTPFPVYRQLAQARLDWTKVYLVATDERWVSSDHPARNSREMRSAFAAAEGIHVLDLVPSTAEQPADAQTAETALAGVSEPFDAVLLGMGGDGHFASLFPGAAALAAGLDPASPHAALQLDPVPLPPEAPYPRISLTLARLMHTRRLFLVATGESKRSVLDRAQAQCDAPDLPVSVLLHRTPVPVEIHWSP